MSYKYTYPVVDRTLRNLFVFVLVLMIVVGVAATLGASSEIIDFQMFYENMESSGSATTAHYEFEQW